MPTFCPVCPTASGNESYALSHIQRIIVRVAHSLQNLLSLRKSKKLHIRQATREAAHRLIDEGGASMSFVK